MGTTEADEAEQGDILTLSSAACPLERELGMYGFDQIVKAADEMGVNRQYALNCRVTYLKSELVLMGNAYTDMVFSALDEPAQDFALLDGNMAMIRKRIDNTKRELDILRRRMRGKVSENEVTDEMIERARRYPVELLVEFKRGKTRAWCHDDRNPSAFHGTRTNTVQCPVCAKSFDSIAVLMQRDVLTFHEAVRRLQ